MGFYLNHHASRRFMRNRDANMRAKKAFQGLIDRSRSMLQANCQGALGRESRQTPTLNAIVRRMIR
jgi:hypothetical protein